MSHHQQEQRGSSTSLNESPSEKEGKFFAMDTDAATWHRPQ